MSAFASGNLLFTSFKLWSGKCRRNGKDDKR